jgi:CRP-like cAMP-binding protein
MVDFEPIRHATILEGLAPSHIGELAAIATVQKLRVGERLFTRGEPGAAFYIVQDGEFTLTVGLRRLGTTVELAVEEKSRGDALGWSALVAPHESIYSCFCTGNGSLVAFPREALEALLSSDAEFGRRFMSNLSQLVGNRVRGVQDLWIEEIQQSMARVQYWTHRDVTHRFEEAMKPRLEQPRSPRRFFRRGRGAPPPTAP